MPCEMCNVGKGSFEGEGAETALLEYYSLNGFSDDIVCEHNNKDVFVGPLEVSEDAVTHAMAVGYCAHCIGVGAEELANCKSATFWIDDYGFRFSELHQGKKT